ncbi:MAG: HAD-IA family hydrolase, partial [Lachnospiraceae bacterium]|nr:HAD-IA family hydrolase [Lachnospiraceae bacterium]
VIDGKVVSYEVHKIKPDPGIYQCLLDRYHLKPEECLFFDDRRENVEAGRRMGISGIQVESEEQLYAILAEIIE